jgi:tRNA A-37 threonylcarbamoyl transferase component Bud32
MALYMMWGATNIESLYPFSYLFFTTSFRMSAPASIHIQGHSIPIDESFKLTVSEIYDGESYNLSIRLGDPSESGSETTFSDGTTFKQRIVNKASPGALGDRITAGSFGEIYKLTIPSPAVMSHDPRMLSGTFTVKVLRKITEEAVRRELQGLIAVYNLPCCSQLRAAIASFDGVYILMDWVEGVTYDKLTSSEAKAHVDAQLGPCLAAIHERGLLHRDIKPNNIIVESDGRPTFIDFGLSAVIGEPDMGPLGPRQYRHPRYDGSKSQDIGLDIEALNQVIAGTQFSASEFRGGRRNKRKSQIKRTTKSQIKRTTRHKEKAKKRTQKRLRR